MAWVGVAVMTGVGDGAGVGVGVIVGVGEGVAAGAGVASDAGSCACVFVGLSTKLSFEPDEPVQPATDRTKNMSNIAIAILYLKRQHL